MLKAIFEYANYDRQEVIDTLEQAQVSRDDSEIKKTKTRLANVQKRINELEKLICRIYEDNILESYLITDMRSLTNNTPMKKSN